MTKQDILYINTTPAYGKYSMCDLALTYLCNE